MKQFITVSLALLAILATAAAQATPASSQNDTQSVAIDNSSVLTFETTTKSGTKVPVSSIQFSGLPAWAKLNESTVVVNPPENQLETVPVCVKYAGADGIFRYRAISLTADTKPKTVVQSTHTSLRIIPFDTATSPTTNSIVVVLPGPGIIENQ